jgi:hypothetical protein
MSKALSDMLGRLQGDMLALQGMAAKYAGPPPASTNITFEQQAYPPPPAPMPTREDYVYTMKLLEEIEGICKAAEEEIKKEMKIPPPPGAEGESSSPQSTPASGKEAAHQTAKR